MERQSAARKKKFLSTVLFKIYFMVNKSIGLRHIIPTKPIKTFILAFSRHIRFHMCLFTNNKLYFVPLRQLLDCLNFKSRRLCYDFYARAVICVLKCNKLKFIKVFMINVKHIFKGICIKYPEYLRILLAYPEIYEPLLR